MLFNSIFFRPQVLSNLIYLFPLVFAFKQGYFFEMILMFCVIITSVWYHSFSKEVRNWWIYSEKVSIWEFIVRILDCSAAGLVVVFFTYRFINNSPNLLQITLFVFIVFVAFIFFTNTGKNHFLFKNISITTTHSIWHILSGVLAFIALT